MPVPIYNSALLLDHPTMTKFYEPWALLRDVDHAEVFKCSLQGIGNLKFSFNTNAPMLDIWSQNTLELTGLVAPQHSKSSKKQTTTTPEPSTRSFLATPTAQFENSFSDVTSYVSESTNLESTMGDFDDGDGVQVMRKKMKKRRRREARKAQLSITFSGGLSGSPGSSYVDCLSVGPSNDSEFSEPTRLDLDELDEAADWTEKPEADQNIIDEGEEGPEEQDGIRTLKVPSPIEAQKFTKIAFTELLSSSDSHERIEIDQSGDLKKKIDFAELTIEEQIETVPEPIDEMKDESIQEASSDTESQAHEAALEKVKNEENLEIESIDENIPEITKELDNQLGESVNQNDQAQASGGEQVSFRNESFPVNVSRVKSTASQKDINCLFLYLFEMGGTLEYSPQEITREK